MKISNIDKSKFVLVNEEAKITDIAFETKEISFYKDTWNRFKRNKASFVAFIIICIVFFFVLVGPHMKVYKTNENLALSQKLGYLPPKIPGLEKLGIFDGKKTIKAGKNFLLKLYNDPNGEGIIISGIDRKSVV